MTPDQKRQIRYELDRLFERNYGIKGSGDHDEKVDKFLTFLEKMWLKSA